MEKKVRGIKAFCEEFKTFITRDNVLDMAVGVIVGGAFTGVVNGLSNYILKPLINWLLAIVLGKDGLEGAITMLQAVYGADNQIDLTKSIYIDWGSFISSIINFLLVALTLFVVVRTINRIRDAHDKVKSELDLSEKKAIIKIRREEKVPIAYAKKLYEERKAAALAAQAEAERIAAEEAAAKAAEEEAKLLANTRLLEEIRDLLKANK